MHYLNLDLIDVYRRYQHGIPTLGELCASSSHDEGGNVLSFKSLSCCAQVGLKIIFLLFYAMKHIDCLGSDWIAVILIIQFSHLPLAITDPSGATEFKLLNLPRFAYPASWIRLSNSRTSFSHVLCAVFFGSTACYLQNAMLSQHQMLLRMPQRFLRHGLVYCVQRGVHATIALSWISR